MIDGNIIQPTKPDRTEDCRNHKSAVDSSPNKDQIDRWLNEGRAIKWISNELEKLDDYISPVTISKYKKKRELRIKEELESMPQFEAKQKMVTQLVNDKVAQIQTVDLMGNLSQLIEDSAELLADAKARNIQINSIKDMRMVQQTMLDAITAYGETMLNAQKFQEINKDPSLLKSGNTTVNIEIKQILTDVLKSSIEEGGEGAYGLVDKLRQSCQPR